MDIKEHDILSKNLLKSLETQGDTELMQTHISTIILSGDLVYKLKKPVDFGFLDYSTLDKRHKNSLEEVRINEGFAPKLYLGVIPITGTIENPQVGGEGRVLDYAVKMRRFSQSDQLDNILKQEGLEIESMDKIAKVIARFHEASDPVDTASDYGEPQRVLSPMLENFDLLQSAAVQQALDLELSSVIAWTHKQFKKLKPLLQHRKKEGFVRECHGDMHLHNMALHEGELILFDAIEFNTYLNHIDVISDLAFLLMDLEYRGLARHSHRLLNHYLELTGDYEGVALLDFYKTYRAMVRAKVAALRVAQEIGSDERRVMMDEVTGYISLALSYTEEKGAFFTIMHGFSGSGKSTFALMMVEQYGALRIRSDTERIRMFERSAKNVLEEGIYTPDATKATYEHLFALAISVYESGYPVIVDATFLKQWQRRLFGELSSKHNGSFLILDLQCDTKIMRDRILKRSDTGIDISQADLDVLEKQMQTAQALSNKERENCFVVDCSSMESLNRAMDALTNYLKV